MTSVCENSARDEKKRRK